MIWLNGTFGVGKTSTADELVRRMPGSRLYDPEEVGFLLHRLLPEAADSDFQDIPLRDRIIGHDMFPEDPQHNQRVQAWRLDHLPDYADALPWLRATAHVIDTTHLSPAQVADAVLRHHNLNDTVTAAR